jgi:phosphoribosylformylglycinamidine synthase I
MEAWIGGFRMKREDINVLIIRVGGTNCDLETKRAFETSNMKAEIVHFNKLYHKIDLLDYDIFVIPGGFSHGDYVRAGAIWAKQLMAKLNKKIRQFIEEERPILGICNGFQVLIEAGLLPSIDGISIVPEAVLGPNRPLGYNCRWLYLKPENRSHCIFTQKISSEKVLRLPIAHAEGRFIPSSKDGYRQLDRLKENKQIILRYCFSNGDVADGKYPSNPNGSIYDIAGISNPSGTTLGLMPHPERAYFGWQLPDWTKNTEPPTYGDGRFIFESVAEYLTRKF